MAMVIAGFSGVEADFLRKAMSFKRSDERMNAIVNKLKTRYERTASCTRGSANESSNRLAPLRFTAFPNPTLFPSPLSLTLLAGSRSTAQLNFTAG
jgi:hypothetical protein